jgi:hypothetical protein
MLDLQQMPGGPVEGDRSPARVGLGWPDHEFSIDAHDSPVDCQQALRQVEVRPLESHGLTPAQPCQEKQPVEGASGRLSDRTPVPIVKPTTLA